MDTYPLRSCIGTLVRIPGIEVRTVALPQDLVSVHPHARMEDALAVDHAAFFPHLVDAASGARLAEPAAGSGRIPPGSFEGDYAFAAASFLSIGVDPHRTAEDLAREAPSIELELSLGEAIRVGGIGMLGHPYLPQSPDAASGSRCNFGLPQEVAILPGGAHQSRFVDSEPGTIVQQPVGHGGLHLYGLEPVFTDRLILQLRNLPLMPTVIDTQGTVRGERIGLLIAAMFVYAHAQSVRHVERASAGLMASAVGKPGRAPAGGRGRTRSRTASQASVPYAWGPFFLGTDLVRPAADTRQGLQHYVVESAAAAVSGPRPTASGQEQFQSPPLHPGEALWLYLAQAEEYPRSLAGIDLTFGRQKSGMGPRPPLIAEAYSVDPLPGESPVIWPTEPDDHFSHTRLARQPVNRTEGRARLRFDRQTTQPVILLRLVNQGNEGDAFTLSSVALLRSASQVVVPRSSCRQRIERLHYRVVGTSLADDYARIGDACAAIRVTMARGRGGEVELFKANSLLDLIQNGARLVANHRHWNPSRTVVEEWTETHAARDVRETGTTSEGWRMSGQGSGVSWPVRSRPVPPGASDKPPGPFQSYSSSETRTQTEHVGHETAGALRPVMSLLEQLGLDSATLNIRQRLDQDGDGFIDDRPPRLREDDAVHPVSWNTVWGSTPGIGYVGVLSHLNLPPYVHALSNPDQAVAALQQLAALPGELTQFLEDPLGAASELGSEVAPLIGFLTMVAASALGNLSFSIGGQLVGGVSVSATSGLLIPQLSYSSTEGTTGMISKQGYRANHSYSQSYATSYDHMRSVTDTTGGSSHRTVTTARDEEKSRKERQRGAEVRWQDREVDILAGSVPIGITMPSRRDEVYGTLDQILKVTIDHGRGQDDVEIDVWFDIKDEIVREED